MAKLTIRLDPDEHEKLRDLSERDDKPIQKIVARLIRNYLRLRGAA